MPHQFSEVLLYGVQAGLDESLRGCGPRQHLRIIGVIGDGLQEAVRAGGAGRPVQFVPIGRAGQASGLFLCHLAGGVLELAVHNEVPQPFGLGRHVPPKWDLGRAYGAIFADDGVLVRLWHRNDS